MSLVTIGKAAIVLAVLFVFLIIAVQCWWLVLNKHARQRSMFGPGRSLFPVKDPKLKAFDEAFSFVGAFVSAALSTFIFILAVVIVISECRG